MLRNLLLLAAVLSRLGLLLEGLFEVITREGWRGPGATAGEPR